MVEELYEVGGLSGSLTDSDRYMSVRTDRDPLVASYGKIAAALQFDCIVQSIHTYNAKPRFPRSTHDTKPPDLCSIPVRRKDK